jgi:hypothetical protein
LLLLRGRDLFLAFQAVAALDLDAKQAQKGQERGSFPFLSRKHAKQENRMLVFALMELPN